MNAATITIPGIDLLLTELREIKALLAKREPEPQAKPGKSWSIADAAEHLGISESAIRMAVKDGRIRAARFGRRITIGTAEQKRLEEQGL